MSVSVALVVFACYNPTVVKTNVLCLPCSCTAINAARLVNYLINHLVNRLVNRPALVVVTAAAAIVAAATATATAAATARVVNNQACLNELINLIAYIQFNQIKPSHLNLLAKSITE
jgi:hypothetical protein